MATASKPTADPAVTSKVTPDMDLPASWADAELLDGMEVLDKSDLIGRPFLITAFKQSVSTGPQQYAMVWVEGVFATGEAFTFNDSSAKQGVRADAEEILISKGKVGAEFLDVWVPVKIVCPKGLRVSPYEKPDPITGKIIKGRNYYLTRSGKRSTN
jgi:hypothetical protein